MADAGGGNDHFAATPDEAPSIFAEEFEGLAKMVAQNLSVEIRPDGPAINVGILNEYPITTVGKGLQAAMGDAYGGQARKLVFRVDVPAMSEVGEVKVADVVIRWADITAAGTVKMHTRTIPIQVNVVTGAEAAGQHPDSTVTEEVVILGAAKARKDARKLADEGHFDQARQLLGDQAELLSSISSGSALFEAATEDIEQLEKFRHRMEMRTYDPTDSKEMWEQSRSRLKSEKFRKRPQRPT